MNPPLPDPNFDRPSVPPPIPASAMQGDSTGGIIPFKNPKALAAYYVGLFSILPLLSYVMAPLAIWLGVQGLKYAKVHPVVKGQAHAWVGIVCGGFWTLVYYGFTLLALIAWAANRH